MGILKNIVTFGAAGRIEEAQSNYESVYKKYEKLKSKYENKNSEIQSVFRKLIELKMKVQNTTKKINYFPVLNASVKNRIDKSENTKHLNISQLEYVTKSLESGDILMNSIKGTGAALTIGGAVAPATLWLVGTFGTASTGTAISALSGVAATNAALALLGGGTLAAGGGGVAAGTAVLTALGPIVGLGIGAVALPLFSHLSANKKIKEIKEAEYKIHKAINELKGNLLTLDIYEKRSYELIDSLNKGTEAFNFMYDKLKKKLFPLGFISKLFRNLKVRFTKKSYYSDEEWKDINLLLKTTKELLEIRDTPVIDNNNKKRSN